MYDHNAQKHAREVARLEADRKAAEEAAERAKEELANEQARREESARRERERKEKELRAKEDELKQKELAIQRAKLEAERKAREEARLKALAEADRKEAEEDARKEAAEAAKRKAAAEAALTERASTQTVKCPTCGGGKTVPCDACFRTGKVTVGKVCPECNGVKTTCPTCQGVGNVMCVPCNGTGKNLDIYGRPVPRRIGPFLYANCQICGGDGRVQCPGARCDKKGMLVCDRCRNRGKISVQEACTACDGKARKDCQVCNATGEVIKKD